MFNFKLSLNLEKRLVFYINLFLIILVSSVIFLSLDMSTFFYINIFVTFFLSLLFFKKSKKLSRTLIITNMFILFYFFSGIVIPFLFRLFDNVSYYYLLFYNLILGVCFLFFSGKMRSIYESLKNFKLSILFLTFMVGFMLSFLFIFFREPVSGQILDVYATDFLVSVLLIASFAFLVGLSEQIIFSGFLYQTYLDLTNENEAKIHTSIMFVLFHLLGFAGILRYYEGIVGSLSWFYILGYLVSLGVFMYVALYFFSFKSKNYSGNIVYAVGLHFSVDLILFMFYYLRI